jgi:hypothetical protein
VELEASAIQKPQGCDDSALRYRILPYATAPPIFPCLGGGIPL